MWCVSTVGRHARILLYTPTKSSVMGDPALLAFVDAFLPRLASPRCRWAGGLAGWRAWRRWGGGALNGASDGTKEDGKGDLGAELTRRNGEKIVTSRARCTGNV